MALLKGISVAIILTLVPLVLWFWGIILYATLKLSLTVLFVLFVLVPLIFKYTYALQRSMIFLNFVNWPRNVDFTAPHKYGLKSTRNFYITSDEGVKLGVWHTLPASLDPFAHNTSDPYYEDALSHGEPVILYMHGNSGSRASPHRVELYRMLRALNYHVISFDYRSYGDSDALVPSEKGVVADGKSMYRWLERRVEAAPIIVWGHSLGTGVSSHVLALLAREGTHAKGLVLESPFNNLHDELKEHPFSKLFRHLPWFDSCFLDPVMANELRFESDRHLTKFLSPVLILHAEDDLVVPYILGRRLYHSALEMRPQEASTVEFVRFDAKHNYGHKFICRAPELPEIIKNFVGNSTQGKPLM